MKYCPQLDGLRAVAVVAVVMFHCAPFGPVPGGFIGVDLFFVLSAFLITGLLLGERERTGSIDLRAFYLKRLLRLWPALALMLAGYLAFATFAWPGYPHGVSAMLAGLYLTDISVPLSGVPKYIEHTWSLAIEEQFYLVAPVALLLLVRSSRPILWLLALFVAMTLWRGTFDAWMSYYHRPDTHSTGLVLGAILCLSGWKAKPWAGWLGLAIFATILATANIRNANAVIPAAEMAAAMMIASAANGGMKWLTAPPLVHIGKLSYGIYLWHYPIAFYLRRALDYPVTLAFVLGLSYALAFVSYRTVEEWGRRQRARIGRRSTPALASV